MALKVKFFLLLNFPGLNCFSQDTLKYEGFLDGKLLIESMELYPDKTFKWTSEYDLSWSENGRYSIMKDTLVLYYTTRKNNTETFLISDVGLVKLDSKGKPTKKLKDKSINRKWARLRGHKYKYEIKKL